MNIQCAEKNWLDLTAEEVVHFPVFNEEVLLRRPKNGLKALAALKFGFFKDLSGNVIHDERVIWLSYIMSESPGAGAVLLRLICHIALRNGLAIYGEPVPLRPSEWDPNRTWPAKETDLIAWYMKHRFHIVQDSVRTQMWWVPSNLIFSVQTSLKNR